MIYLVSTTIDLAGTVIYIAVSRNFKNLFSFWWVPLFIHMAPFFIISTVIYLIGATIYIALVLQFNPEEQEGNVSTHDSVLPVEPVKHTKTYSLEDEH